MALIKCKECDRLISSETAFCPNCGAVSKKKTGCFTWLVAGFFIFVIIGGIRSFSDKDSNRSESTSRSSTPSVPSKDKPQYTLYQEGATVTAGYTAYAVSRSWWSNSLGDDQIYRDYEHAPARYLFVELTVRNDDKQARSIASFKLIDENDAEYETSSKSWTVAGSIGIFTRLNPGVSKGGCLIFEVPRGHEYRLTGSDGYWSRENAFVQLSPKASESNTY